ncbi:LacI family DNA-binding transcriptional regulator [Micromonospora sp. LZ34]
MTQVELGELGTRRRATIRDVATQAGVSVASVSRVLSGKYSVGADTRSRVLRAVEDLGFVVNAHARALSSEQPGTIALVVHAVTASFLAEVAQAVAQQAAAEGKLCLVCTTQGHPDRELEVVNLMREQGARAVLLVGGVVETEDYLARMRQVARGLKAAGSHLVFCGRPAPAADLPASVVTYDNEGGAYAMTSFLLSAGHRRILFLGGDPGHTTATERVAGYRRALTDWSIPFDPMLVQPGQFTRAFGYQRTKALLANGPDFTAVFAANDLVAAGVLLACREVGVAVPDDLSVVGYDDLPQAADLVPALTTVRIPHAELGRAAVRAALHPDNTMDDHVLGTHVVVRDSVRPPRR